MSERNPLNMKLGDIVKELTLLSSVKTLVNAIGTERAYAMAPTHCRDIHDLSIREDLLYEELNKREQLYNEQFSQFGSF